MFCKNCGRSLKENEKFCPNCGAKRDNSIKAKNNSSNNSIVSIILGIIAIIVPIIGLPFSIIGLIFGIKAKKEEKNPAGMILSIIGLIFSILCICFIIFIIFLVATDEQTYQDNKTYDNEESFDDFFDHFDDILNENMDNSIEGYKWKSVDGSILYLYNDGKYIWYQNDLEHHDNYTEGTYRIKKKEEAVNYIANISEYNLSKEQQYKFFDDSKNSLYKIENYIYIELNCNKNITDGKESKNALGLISYYGFYDNSSYSLEVSNLKTASSSGFVRYGRIS